MGFFKKISQALSGVGQSVSDNYMVYVRCTQCGEALKSRINLMNDLSLQYGEGGEQNSYYCRKMLIGASRCFQKIEVKLTFNANRKLIDRQISGGEFISEEEFELYIDQTEMN